MQKRIFFNKRFEKINKEKNFIKNAEKNIFKCRKEYFPTKNTYN